MISLALLTIVVALSVLIARALNRHEARRELRRRALARLTSP